MEKRQLLSQMFLGKQDICMQKTESISISFTLYKYQLKFIKDLNIRFETLKLVQERVGNKLQLIVIENGFLNRTEMA
jgi:hypothetical protein